MLKKKMNDVIVVIMNLRKNKNEDIQLSYPESEPCDECGVDNVWDLSFSAFVDHMEHHRVNEKGSSHTRRNGSPEFIDNNSGTSKEKYEYVIKKVGQGHTNLVQRPW